LVEWKRLYEDHAIEVVVWGRFWGMLLGAAAFAIPGIGPVLVAGPLVAWIIGALEGAVVVGGLTAVGVDYSASVSLRTAS
jgi:hypothetical protein